MQEVGMTTRRPPRGKSTAQHLAEIHRQLQRNDRRMARLARTLENLFDLLRDLHGTRPSQPVERRSVGTVETPPEL